MDSDIRLGEIVVLDTSASALSNTISITQDPVPAAPRTILQTTLIMAALCTAVFLAAIDTVILTTALPTIASDIDASSAGFAWIGSAFLLADAASMPLWSTSSDIFGRKPLLLLANTTLMLGSLISALAPSLAALLVGRAVQGLGAGGLTVLVSITVSDLFAMRRRGLMLALIGSVSSFASTIGPVVGGALAERASWRWCFWVNLPCNAASLLLLSSLLKIHTPRTHLLAGLAALDWLGGLTLSSGTVMLLLALSLGATSLPWSSSIVLTLLILGPCTLLLFLIIESRLATHPIIPLQRIITTPSNAASLLICSVHGTCYISVACFLPLYLQSVLTLPPLPSGAWSLPTALTLLIATLSSGIYMQSTGRYRDLIIVGLSFLILGLGLVSTLPPTLSPPRLILFQTLVALGIAPLFQAPLIALQTHLKSTDTAAGTAMAGFARALAAGISLVVGQAVFQAGMRSRSAGLVKAGVPARVVEELGRGSGMVGAGIMEGLSAAQREMVRGAMVESLSRMWIFYTAVAGVGLLAGLGLRKREMSNVHVEVKTGLESVEGGNPSRHVEI